MNESRLERLSPLTGAASVVLMVIGVVAFNYYEPLASALLYATSTHTSVHSAMIIELSRPCRPW